MSAGRLGNLELTTGTVETSAVQLVQQRAHGEALRSVPVSALARSPWQPRTKVERDENFLGLVDSVRERGVLEPLLARELADGRLELLAGERRLEAAREAKLASVPVRVFAGLEDTDAREVALVENLARKDLTAWEEAQGLAALASMLEAAGKPVTVRKLAHVAGRSKSVVDRARRIAETCTPDVLKSARKLPGGATVPTWDKLPATVLEAVSREATPEKRAKLLVVESAGYLPPAPHAPHRKRRARTARPPVTVKATPTGAWSLSLAMSPAKLPKADARKALDALEPIVKALRARVK